MEGLILTKKCSETGSPFGTFFHWGLCGIYHPAGGRSTERPYVRLNNRVKNNYFIDN